MNTDLRYQALTGIVMARIAERRLRRTRMAAALHGGILLAALAAFMPALQYAMTSAARSGFSAYMSLLASDGGSLLGYWREFGLTVIESAPIMAGAMVLGILLVFAYAARKTFIDIGRLRLA